MGKELSDLNINFAQALLKQQYRFEKGFYSTLLQGQQHPSFKLFIVVVIIGLLLLQYSQKTVWSMFITHCMILLTQVRSQS